MLNDLPTAQEVADEMMTELFDYTYIHRIIFVTGFILLAVILAAVIAIFTDIDLDNNPYYDCERGEIIYFWSDKIEVVRVSPHNCQMIKERND